MAITEMTRSNHGDDTWESQRCHVAISAVSCQVYDCVDAVLHAQPLRRRADGTRIIELRPQLSWHKVEMSREKSRDRTCDRSRSSACGDASRCRHRRAKLSSGCYER